MKITTSSGYTGSNVSAGGTAVTSGKTGTSSSVAPTVTLSSGQSYVDKVSGQTIVGAAGNEIVSIVSNVGNAWISNVGTVNLAGKGSDYYAYSYGSKVLIYLKTNSVAPVAIITPPATSTGTAVTFADGGQASIAISQGVARFHQDIIQLAANGTVCVGGGNVVVRGSSGVESVFLDSAWRDIRIDSKVEKIVFNDKFGSLATKGSDGMVTFVTASGAKVADLSLVPGCSETIYFSNAKGMVTLDAAGKGVFNLDAIILSLGDTFTATNGNIKISGDMSSDATTVILSAGVGNASIGAAIGQVKLAGKMSDYLYKGSGGSLLVYDKAGSVVATIQIQKDANGTQLYFGDGVSQAATAGKDGVKVGTLLAPTSASGDLKVPETSTISTPTKSSTGDPVNSAASFKYSLSLGDFGQYKTIVEKSLITALDTIGKYISAKGEFNVQVIPKATSENFIAEAYGSLVRSSGSLQAANGTGINYSTAFQVESRTGVDPNGSTSDAVVHINTAYISKMNADPASAPKAGQFDLTSVLMHEIMHTLGFCGFMSTSAASVAQSAFDAYVTMQNGKPYFTGANAKAVYGGPVPLAPASAGPGSAYYHVDVSSDLMSKSIGYAQVKSISALDVAILKDIGVDARMPEVVPVGLAPTAFA